MQPEHPGQRDANFHVNKQWWQYTNNNQVKSARGIGRKGYPQETEPDKNQANVTFAFYGCKYSRQHKNRAEISNKRQRVATY
jgi:hypothetical protein